MRRAEYTNATRLAWGQEVVRPLRELAPFAAIALIAWVAVLVGATIDWLQYGLSVLVMLGSAAFGVLAAARGRLTFGTVTGSVGFLAAVGLLRNAGGGSVTGVSILSLLAVFQTALYLRSRASLAVVLAAVAGMYLIPLAVVGSPTYPATGYRGALLDVALSAVIGVVTQGLVADVRGRAEEARLRARMLVQVNRAVQVLYDSPNARADVCRAVKEIGGAAMAIMYEPTPDTEELRCTASTIDGSDELVGFLAAPNSAPYRALTDGQEILISENVELHLGNADVWRSGGSPSTVLYQPLRRGDKRLGVLAVGWSGHVDPESSSVIVAALLAHEAAAVIGRADFINQLTDAAHTDALTRLPNRRAWDERLRRAITKHKLLAVAMFDLDLFKQYNDTYGHPAGDRLLRDTATAWRAAMRTGDFLARIGGEEFAMLITEADLDTATSVVERLRESMPSGQTCSAGIAICGVGESPEELLIRADQALYGAKADGRDCTRIDTLYTQQDAETAT
jgi:diguanylate cyclase (GGDEF)-like protein